MNDMKEFIEQNPLEVIEKFGGIRPMATKLGVAATTIQGWKKRENIPDNRVDDIVRVANENNIMLASKPNIEHTIAQIKARIEEPKVQSAPDEELMEFPGEDDKEEASAAPVQKTVMVKPIIYSPSTMPEPKAKFGTKKEEVTEQKPDDLEDTVTKKDPSTPPTLPTPTETISASAPAKPPVKEMPKITEIEDKLAPPAIQQKQSTPAERPQAANNNSGGSRGWALPMIVGASVMGLIAIFWPVREDVQVQKERLGQIEESINDLKSEQNTFMSAIGEFLPEDAKAQLDNLRVQTGQIAAETGNLATAIIGAENAALIKDGFAGLKAQMFEMIGGADLNAIMERFSELGGSETGQEQMSRALAQLRGIIESLDGRTELLDEALVIARENSTALGETFQGIDNQDLTAGALLLALNEFRSAVNRDNTPFEEDLALLYGMIGEDNTALREALDRLAPQAESGILSARGLSDEFRTLAGEIAVSSLKGEETNAGTQASERVSQVLKIGDKGTNAPQEKVEEVQSQLESGDLRGALSNLSTFTGDAAVSLSPFINELESTLAAQDIDKAIQDILQAAKSEITGVKPLNLKNLSPSTTERLTPNTIVRDGESGFSILPEKSLNNSFKNLNIEP